MPCYQPNNAPPGYFPIGTGGYATEAECLNACKEGACCNGTTCSVKPQCQCDAEAGEVFKGVGTVCSPNPCNMCGLDCATAAALQSQAIYYVVEEASTTLVNVLPIISRSSPFVCMYHRTFFLNSSFGYVVFSSNASLSDQQPANTFPDQLSFLLTMPADEILVEVFSPCVTGPAAAQIIVQVSATEATGGLVGRQWFNSASVGLPDPFISCDFNTNQGARYPYGNNAIINPNPHGFRLFLYTNPLP